MNIVLLVGGLMNKEANSLTTISLAKQLINEGHKVLIIHVYKNRKFDFSEIPTIPVITVNKSIFSQYVQPAFIVRKISKVDVIHSFSSSPIIFLKSLIIKSINWNVKLVHSLKSYPIIKDIKSKKSNGYINKFGSYFYWLLNFADYVSVSTIEHAKKIEHTKLNKKKLKVIHSFIDHKKFIPRDKAKLKQEYGLTSKVVLYYGSLWEVKGSVVLIKAVKKIVKEIENIKFIFIPRNPSAIKYKNELLAEGLDKKVSFIFEDVKIEDYVALADVVVLPYPHLEGTEGNPSCLLEAMACKTPVVTTQLPEIKEIADGCVLMAKPGDVDSLVESVKSALTSDTSKMVENGYQKVKKFDVELISKQFIDLYRDV